jgi:hypothetical protein
MNDPTLPANDRYVRAIYNAGGTLQFSFDFSAYEASDVEVYIDNVQWAFTEDYSVTLVDNSGGFVNLLKVPTDGARITIVGATPYVRTETYVPPTADVSTLNVECTKDIYRLQQLNRDIYGCLKNIREETEEENTKLPRTADRKGHLATWGTQTGRLTYAGDPDEGGEDPTADFLRKHLNLSDVADARDARENLGVIQGHAVNGQMQRPNLLFTGDGVGVYDAPATGTTVVRLIQTVKTFNDLLGICPIAKGGTGADNVTDAKKNLMLSALASTGDFRDLKNVPYIISNIANLGNGVTIGGTILNGIATLRSLTSSDSSVAVAQTADHNAVDLKVGSVSADHLTGVLQPNHGGTGLGAPEMAAARPGDALTISPDHRWTTANIPRGHVISGNGVLEPQRPVLRFQGDLLSVTDGPGETIVHFGDFPRGDVYDFAVSSGDFSGDRLTIHSVQLPFEITGDIMVQTYDGKRFYTDCGIRVFPGDRIEISGNPFDGNVLIYSGTDGNFAAVSFSASDFVGAECRITNGSIGFFPTGAIVQCVFNQGSYLEHVNVTLVQVDGDVRIISAIPFNGKLLVRGGKPQFDSYYTHNIDSQAFDGSSLFLPAEAFPFPLIRPLLSIQRNDGQWINCSVRIPEYGAVTITAEPFNGGITVLQGIRALWSHSLEILNPDGILLPREPRLQFTGSVTVSDDMVAGKTVVNVEGGDVLHYRGTFGSATSSTTGDLPLDPADGDLYDCAADGPYASAAAGITFQPGQQAVYVADVGWVARPMADTDPSKANRDASNLTASDVAAWQDVLGGGPGPAGGDYVPISWNTIYGPEAYDRLVIISRRSAGHGSQTIFIGSESDAVTQIIARTSANTDRSVSFFCSAKVPAGKYFRVTYDSTNYGADYNFMVRM